VAIAANPLSKNKEVAEMKVQTGLRAGNFLDDATRMINTTVAATAGFVNSAANQAQKTTSSVVNTTSSTLNCLSSSFGWR